MENLAITSFILTLLAMIPLYAANRAEYRLIHKTSEEQLLGSQSHFWRNLVYIILSIASLLMAFIGLFSGIGEISIGANGLPTNSNPIAAGPTLLGWLFLAGSVISLLILYLPQLDTWAQKLRPQAPDTLLSRTILFYAFWLLINAFGSIGISLPELDIIEIVLINSPYMIAGLIGVGWLSRRSIPELKERLKLKRLTGSAMGTSILLIVAFIAMSLIIDSIFKAIDPAGYSQASEGSAGILRAVNTVWAALALGLVSGIGEELLFRGALQPRVGIVGTSILFAVLHTQYGITIALVQIFLLSLGLGWIRNKHSTTAAILVHFGYNTLLSLSALAAAG